MRSQPERAGVFARVQLPQDQTGRQPLLSDRCATSHRNNEITGRQPLLQSSRNALQRESRNFESRYPDVPRDNRRYKGNYHDQETETSRGARYGGSRYGSGPYDCKEELTWWEKPKARDGVMVRAPTQVRNESAGYGDAFPYEKPSNENNILIKDDQNHRSRDKERSGGKHYKQKLASTIVSASIQPPMEDNVTIMTKSSARSLTYSPHASEEALGN
ncbi:hypothetical protein F2Q69_00042459 [Brassica cretica]|uniref:Uncharacterized protein n=1 Tax=Brassica cretica TaxID=69181 RepID=A0A8S9NTT8_BRACR|nr:hypothetical protein F2Q69_00042459 [Brassica cretica]